MPTLHFKGRSAVETLHLSLSYSRLISLPESSPSSSPSLDDNLIIHGDNLLALKALLPSYGGKVKLVYIDPPYNRSKGNEKWVYNDRVNDPRLQEWLGKEVGREDLTRHDKWLCMMLPRLRLLHDLMREDGVIFVSIDDNEVHHLRMLMNDVFGEDNFVEAFVWRKVDSPNDNKVPIASDHEYLLCYAKDTDQAKFRQLISPSILAAYGSMDAEGRPYRDRLLKKNGKNSLRRNRPSMFFSIEDPDGNEVYPIHDNGEEACWSYGPKAVASFQQAKTLVWKRREKLGKEVWEPYTREYAPEEPTRPYPTIWADLSTMRQAKSMLRDIFATADLFDTPKPVELIQRLLRMATTSDDIVLDSFAGSGTTGHAVLAQNREDGGSRKFILIEQEDYADSITAERIRRVILGIPDAKDEGLHDGYRSNFSFFRLGEPLDEERMLAGDLPGYAEMARHVFFTATGETLDEAFIDESRQYIGESSRYEVYLIYKPDVEYLKRTPLTLAWAEALPSPISKPRLVIAPYKLLDTEVMRQYRIDFCQLPFGIYRYRA